MPIPSGRVSSVSVGFITASTPWLLNISIRLGDLDARMTFILIFSCVIMNSNTNNTTSEDFFKENLAEIPKMRGLTVDNFTRDDYNIRG